VHLPPPWYELTKHRPGFVKLVHVFVVATQFWPAGHAVAAAWSVHMLVVGSQYWPAGHSTAWSMHTFVVGSQYWPSGHSV
jgi:hypothetical protein